MAATKPRKQRGKARRDDELALLRRYQHVVEAAGDVIYTTDVDGNCTYINASVQRLFGYEPERVIGSHFLEFVHPTWRRRALAFYTRQMRDRIHETIFEMLVLTAAGEEKWVEQIVVLRVEDDRVLGFEGFVRDIHRRKQAEIALHTSQANLTALMNNTQDSIWAIDRDYCLTAANDIFRQRLAQAYGVQIETGMSVLDHITPNLQAEWQRYYDRALAGEPFSAEYDHSGRGMNLKTEMMFTPIIESGEITGVTIHSRNITARKQVEQALRESEERYRSLIENATDVIFTLDADARIGSLNPAFETITGLSAADWIGRPFTSLIHVQDLALVMTMFRRVIEQSEAPPSFELRVACAAGGFVTGEFKVKPQIENGVLVGLMGIARDITDRKRAEAERNQYINQLEVLHHVDSELSQRLKTDYVLNIALDAAVRLSKADAGAIHLVEDAGHIRVAQVIGNYPRTLVGSYVPPNKGIVGRVLHTQQAELVDDVSRDPDYVDHVAETRAQITIPLIARERCIGTLNVQTSRPERFTQRIFDFLKLLTARIATALDNARLYQMLQDQVTELQTLYQQVKELEGMKTEIIRVASHDMRNPLGVISGFLQMFTWELEPKLSDRHKEHLQIIKQSVDRIDKITNDILTLERIEGQARGILAESIDLQELVRAVYADYQPQAASKGLNCELDLTDIPLIIQGDSIFLRETIANLLSNAIKYTPEGGRVRMRVAPAAGMALVEVIDTGYGIPKDHQANLFQPFFRAASNETKAIKGSGLGLHLVKRIVERHNGEMHFMSVYGQGSTFGFTLPLVNVGSMSDNDQVAASARR